MGAARSVGRRGLRGSTWLLWLAAAACGRGDGAVPAGNDAAATDAAEPPAEAAPADQAGPPPLGQDQGERYWLDAIEARGTTLARICSGARDDLVTRALCKPGVQLAGLDQLYRLLGLDPDGANGALNLSIGAASSGLSFKTVSVVNPRAFLTTSLSLATIPRAQAVVVAFVRGEQLVEIVAGDAKTGDFNFYLLRYRQPCGTNCGLEQLLLSQTESGWTGWSLYTDDELEDTPFTCQSCHQPAGPGSPRRLLMRDFPMPWFQWLAPGFIDVSQPRPCDESQGNQAVPIHPTVDLRVVFEKVHPDGYAAFPTAVARSSDGHNLHSFVAVVGNSSGPFFEPPDIIDARKVLDEWRCSDSQESWRAYRARTLEAAGFPIPYFKYDRLDPQKAAPALQDFAAYLRSLPAGTTVPQALEPLIDPTVMRAIGGIIDVDDRDDPTRLLTTACIRCHDQRAPAGSSRARFDVKAVTPASATEALRRMRLPPASPFVMPPTRAPGLSAEAKDRLLRHLQTLTL